MNKTPESKLLSLIQQSPRVTNHERRAAAGRRARSWIEKIKRGNLREHLNRILFLATTGLVLWSAAVWVNAIFGPPLPRDRRPPMEADPDPRERGESAGNGISRRGLFLTPVAAPAPQPVPLPTVSTPPPPPRIPLGQRVAHLRLVGIINGPKRQAVLDDARQGTTRYVSAGDTIGDVRVERVEKDRVVFTFENEAVDLSL